MDILIKETKTSAREVDQAKRPTFAKRELKAFLRKPLQPDSVFKRVSKLYRFRDKASAAKVLCTNPLDHYDLGCCPLIGSVIKARGRDPESDALLERYFMSLSPKEQMSREEC